VRNFVAVVNFVAVNFSRLFEERSKEGVPKNWRELSWKSALIQPHKIEFSYEGYYGQYPKPRRFWTCFCLFDGIL
jgi:hypothetical protein